LIGSCSIIAAPNTVSVETDIVMLSVVCVTSARTLPEVVVFMILRTHIHVVHDLINLREWLVATIPHQIRAPTSRRENLAVVEIHARGSQASQVAIEIVVGKL
jgi:hypothetical protein